jgi:hypothetical protein
MLIPHRTLQAWLIKNENSPLTAFCTTLAAAFGLFKHARCTSRGRASALAGFCIQNEFAGALTAGNLRMNRRLEIARGLQFFAALETARVCAAAAAVCGRPRIGGERVARSPRQPIRGGIRPQRPFVGCHSGNRSRRFNLERDAPRAKHTVSAVHSAGGAVPISESCSIGEKTDQRSRRTRERCGRYHYTG